MNRLRIPVAAAAVAVLIAGVLSAALLPSDKKAAGYTVIRQTVTYPGGPTFDRDVHLQTTLYVPRSATAAHPAPAVIVSPGFGGTEDSVAIDAKNLASHGFVALAWTMRGFNLLSNQAGKIALDAPDTEGADLKDLITGLSRRKDVLQDSPGDPRVGLTGESYGGGISLIGASIDPRVDAIVPVITWNSLESALVPGGVFKAEYAAVFFALGQGNGCSLFAARVCATYTHLAETGQADATDLKLLRFSSPDISTIKAPTLLIQGEDDTLFPLNESLTTATQLKKQGTPVHLAWLKGGHDKSFSSAQEKRIRGMTLAWMQRYLAKNGKAKTGATFSWDRSNGDGGSASTLPPLRDATSLAVQGNSLDMISNPAGGRPAAISSVPGAGDVGGIASALGFELPGQSASWTSKPLAVTREILGPGSLTLHVTSGTDEAVLFAKLYDVSPNGSAVLPNGSLTPIRLTGVGGAGRDVTITLPALARVIPAGHRIRIRLSTTDLGYAGPLSPASYTVTQPTVSLPLVPLSKAKGYAGLAIVSASIATGILLLGLGIALRRRRRAPDLGDDDVPPVVIRGLAKSYADGFRAVDGVDLTVERGQVLGLLGPNGAGKTTTLRMLAGLITPSEGTVELFGRPVVSGSPVLSRVGLFIEGPGLLPHLSGTENLRLYWTATAPSMEGSFIEEALDIAGLGTAVDRPVRTYSQGMRQRLAIAQAMLGRPDLLVLDEPTNGLDPPQIKEIREVLQRIAASGRTVLVSSHLLSEVEQTCSHVAVMSRGKMVAQGTVDELLADDGTVRIEVDDLAQGRAVIERLKGVTGVEEVDGTLVVELGFITRSDVVEALVRKGIGVLGVTSRRRLEDVFLELLGTSS